MASLRGSTGVLAAAGVASLLAASTAAAQAWNHPSFQLPRTADREFNFAVADGGRFGGTSLIFQWREGMGARSQLSLDIGFAEPDYQGADTYALLGGQYAYQLTGATKDMPLDLLLTAGLYAAIAEVNLIRVPVGVSLGHRFPLERTMAVTPYIHPRLSIDFCSECGAGGDSDTDLGLNVDLGGEFEFNRQLAVRLSATLSGSDWFDNRNALGVSLAWTPARISRR